MIINIPSVNNLTLCLPNPNQCASCLDVDADQTVLYLVRQGNLI